MIQNVINKATGNYAFFNKD